MSNYNEQTYVRFNNSPQYIVDICWENSLNPTQIDLDNDLYGKNITYHNPVCSPNAITSIKFLVYSENNDLSCNTAYNTWQEILNYTGLPANYDIGEYTSKKDVCRDITLEIIGNKTVKLYNAFIASCRFIDCNIEFELQAEYYTKEYKNDPVEEMTNYITERINAEINKKIIDDIMYIDVNAKINNSIKYITVDQTISSNDDDMLI